MPNVEIAVVVACAALSVFLLTFAVRRYAASHGIVDEPNHRSSHVMVTPRGGGLAIVFVVTAWLVLGWLWLNLISLSLAVALLGGSIPLAALGFADDRAGLPVSVRFAVHVAAVAFALLMTGGVNDADGSSAAWGWQALVGVACLWFLNLFNFMDGIDGIAAMEAVFVSAAAALLLGWLGAPSGLTWTWLALAGACLGFLWHNWSPARIFMGDTGSGFLGFVIAVLLVVSTQVTGFSVWTAVILVSAFGADATVTLLRRVARGHGWSVPHRSHVYQRLARGWTSHARVTTVYLALNVLVIFPAAAVSVVAPSFAPLVAITVFVALSGLAWMLGAGTED